MADQWFITYIKKFKMSDMLFKSESLSKAKEDFEDEDTMIFGPYDYQDANYHQNYLNKR